MGAWIRYRDPVTGEIMMVPVNLPRGGCVGVITSASEIDASISITYNLGQAFAWCGLDPIDDLARMVLTGEEAIPLLRVALENARNLSDELFRMAAIAQRCAYIGRMAQDALKAGLEGKQITQTVAIDKEIANITSPTWGVSKDTLIEVYETFLAWAEYRPDGYFELGSH